MTRQEIAKAALEYANEEINAAPYDAFMAGAKWADHRFEIIGNIHDNPELQKGGEEEWKK